MSNRRVNRRLRSSVAVVLSAFAFLVSWAGYQQVVHGAEYRQAAQDQHVREIRLLTPRGVIYDRAGAELAVSRRMATIAANPARIPDLADAARRLAPVLSIPAGELLDRLGSNENFVFLARKVDPTVGHDALALEITGIEVYPEDKRIYPKGALAPQILGFVGTDNVGLAGIEKQYEEVLAGEPGSRDFIGDVDGRSIDLLSRDEGRPGRSIVLTIDEDIQWQVEQVLVDLVERYEARKAAAIVLDPRNGEILALANAPLFDCNLFAEADPVIQRNCAVSDQYEPGSTFKVVVTAAALEGGLVRPDTQFTLPPQIEVYDQTIHEAHTEDLPEERVMTVTEILARSSNVGAVRLSQEVGEERLYEMITRFGFAAKTGIDFPGEAAGSMLDLEHWSGVSAANMAMGQGLSASALQVAAAYGALANDGVWVRPHLVRTDDAADDTRRVVSREVARQLRQMLTDTVSDGTGQAAKVTGYTVAGKTGTAQKVKEGGAGYDENRFVSSFVGMVPAGGPELVVLVLVDEPAKEHFGSVVAAPAFSLIADFALKHLAIAPETDGS